MTSSSEPFAPVTSSSEPVAPVVSFSEPVVVWLDDAEPVVVWLDDAEPVVVWLDDAEPVVVWLDDAEPVVPWLDDAEPVVPWLDAEPVVPWLDVDPSGEPSVAWATPTPPASAAAQKPRVTAPVPRKVETLPLCCWARWRALMRRALAFFRLAARCLALNDSPLVQHFPQAETATKRSRDVIPDRVN